MIFLTYLKVTVYWLAMCFVSYFIEEGVAIDLNYITVHINKIDKHIWIM